MDNFYFILGIFAACCTTFSFLPQALRVWRTREVEQLSIATLSLMLVGVILWLIYGIFRDDIVIIGANVVAMFFVAYIWSVKVSDMREKRKEDDHHNEAIM